MVYHWYQLIYIYIRIYVYIKTIFLPLNHCCKTIFLYGKAWKMAMYPHHPSPRFPGFFLGWPSIPPVRWKPRTSLATGMKSWIWSLISRGKYGKIWENMGKSPFLIGKTIYFYGKFSMAMWNNQMVAAKNGDFHGISWDLLGRCFPKSWGKKIVVMRNSATLS